MGSKVQLDLFWLYLWLTEEIGKRSKQKTQFDCSIGWVRKLQYTADTANTALCPEGLEAEEIMTNLHPYYTA